MQPGERPPSVAQRHPRVGGPHSATLRRRLEMKDKLHGEEAVKVTYELTNHRWAELTLWIAVCGDARQEQNQRSQEERSGRG